MKKTTIMLIVSMLAVIGLSAERSFEENKSIYTNALVRLQHDRSRTMADALKNYSDGLVKLRLRFINEANLDGVKEVDAAKEETYKGNVYTNPTLTELTALYRQYLTFQEKADTDFNKKHYELMKSYQSALERLVTAHLQNNALEAAEAVDAEVKRVKNAMADIASGVIKNEPRLDPVTVKEGKTVSTQLPDRSEPVIKALSVVSDRRSDKSRVVGLWNRPAVSNVIGAGDKDYKFNSDGTFETLRCTGFDGTWNIEGDQVTLTFEPRLPARKVRYVRTYAISGNTMKGDNTEGGVRFIETFNRIK